MKKPTKFLSRFVGLDNLSVIIVEHKCQKVIDLKDKNDMPHINLNHAENKLLLLYLIDKMEIPLTQSQISQFALEGDYINYFSLQQFLAEMVEVEYLEKSVDENKTYYSVTDQGLTALEYFKKRIPQEIKNKVNEYVSANRKSIKKDYEVTANYFYERNSNEYTVKCGIYEDETTLMELNLSVVSKDEAKLICKNWRQNVNELYGDILVKLIGDENE